MVTTEAKRERTMWECEFCSQTVLLDVDGTPWFPAGFVENCRLKDSMVGYECIAFRDRESAARLLALGGGSGGGLTYDDRVIVDDSRRVVLSWLCDRDGISRLRVEASLEVVEDHWHVEWQNRSALVAEFKKRRDGYRDVAIREARPERDYYVYAIKK